MQERFFRPNSVRFRSVKKPRVLNGIDRQELLRAYDPWSSMYKENFCQGISSNLKKKTSGPIKNENVQFDDILSVKSLKAPVGNFVQKGFAIRQKKTDTVNNQKPRRDNLLMTRNGKDLKDFSNSSNIDPKNKKVTFNSRHFKDGLDKTTRELECSKQVRRNLVNTTNEPQSDNNDSTEKKPRLFNYMEKEEALKIEEGENTDPNVRSKETNLEKSIQLINTLTKPELRNNKLEQTNCFGQNETWVDPIDSIHNPVYSRVISDPKSEDFIIKNLHTLLGQKNEYFPHIGGKCLCGDCICGKCRCVHFKYKPKKHPADNMKTIYQEDFVKFDIDRPKPLKAPAELHLFPFKKNLTTQYGTHFNKPNPLPDNFNLINKAKLDNIEPFKNRIRAPVSKNTKYQLDFPDWGICTTESMPPFNPKSLIKIPFFGKNSNADYGDFYKRNDIPIGVQPINNDTRINPLGPNIPINYETCQRKDFIKFPTELLDSTEKVLPKDNLFLNKEKFQNQYKSAQRDFDGRQGNLICPVKLEVERVKTIIRNYARSQRIPY